MTTRLEERLRKVAGVADLTVELGDEGLTGIKVRIHEGSDEGEVLEEIRRILVAYGLRSRRSSFRAGPVPTIASEHIGNGAEEDRVRVARTTELPEAHVHPEDGQLVVVLDDGTRRVTARAGSTPQGAAEAMAKAVSEWQGAPPPERVWVRRLRVEDLPLLLVVIRNPEGVGAGAAVATGSITAALQRAVAGAL